MPAQHLLCACRPSHLLVAHKAGTQHNFHNADAATTRASQVQALLEAVALRQVEQLLHCCGIGAGLTLLVVPEIDQEALQGLVQGLAVGISVSHNNTHAGGHAEGAAGQWQWRASAAGAAGVQVLGCSASRPLPHTLAWDLH